MTTRWIWIVFASLLTAGCGEVTVNPFVEVSDAGTGIDKDAGEDDDDGGPDDDDDGGIDGDGINP